MKKKKALSLALILATTCLLTYFSINSLIPKYYERDTNDFTLFNSDRAMIHLKEIAKAPHAVGMKEHERVRVYITEQLDLLNVDWEIQEDLYYNPDYNSLVKIKNIIAKIPGTDPGSAIAITAHYDSVPLAPGASDNALNVASILEVIRILQEKSPLKNDLLFLFTDGEEEGLHGMELFMAKHDLSQSIDFLLNFEARGTAGASLMFETTPGNYNTIKKFKKASSNIISNSLMTDLYNLMDNNTDYSVIKSQGVQGLNFAFIGEGYNYHTVGDNLENIHIGTFQKQGDHMLNTILYFGNEHLDNLYTTKDGIFFNLFNKGFVVYSKDTSFIIKAIVLIITLLTIFLTFKRSYISLKFITLSLLLQLTTFVFLFFSLPFIQKISRLLGSSISIKMSHDYYNSLPLFFGMCTLVIAIIYTLYIPVTKRIPISNIIVANIICWTFFSILTVFVLQGASFLFDWILLFEILTFLYLLKKSTFESIINNLLAYSSFFIALVLAFPLVYLMTESFSLLNFNLPAILLGLIAFLFIPKLNNLISRKWLFSFTLFLISVITIFLEYPTSKVSTNSRYDSIVRSNKSVIEYYYEETDDSSTEGSWVIYGNDIESYTSLTKEKIPSIPMSNIHLLEDMINEDSRILTLSIQSALPSAHLHINITSEGPTIETILLNNQYSLPIAKSTYLKGVGLEDGDLFLTIIADPDSVIELSLTDNIYGLEEVMDYGIYSAIQSANPNANSTAILILTPHRKYTY